jgi:hypothetical protein
MSDQFAQCVDSRPTLQAKVPSSLNVPSMANGPPTQTKVRNDNSQELIILNQKISQVPIIKNFTKATDFNPLPERVVFKAIKPRNLT